jgi:hypothetical protein
MPGITTTEKAYRKPAAKEHRNAAKINVASKIPIILFSPLLSRGLLNHLSHKVISPN